MQRLVPVVFLLAASCGSSVAAPGGTHASSSTSTSGAGGQAGTTAASTNASSSSAGAGGAQPVDKSQNCASQFGTALTSAFGRIDGTVRAIVKPNDTQCAMPNGTHVVVEVDMGGADYRMVVNTLSTSGDPNVQFLELDHAMPGPQWADGWHTGVTFDYVTDLGLHANSGFMPVAMGPLADRITTDLTVGDKISVYATSSGGSSAHLVHRNKTGADGAIVLHPDTTPRFLLFHFADQTF